MQSIVRWAVKNPVAMNLFMCVTLILGIGSLFRLPYEKFPDFSVDRISVFVPYEGATAEEIEEGICVKIEEAIDGIEGIRRIDSSAEENFGSVVIQINPGVEMDGVLDEVKQAVDQITTFPEQAEDPRIKEIVIRQRVMELLLQGPCSEDTLKRLSRDIRDDLLKLEKGAISQVSVIGTRDYEIAIELDEAKLRAYKLTFAQVAAVVKEGSFNLPAGAVKSDSEEYALRIYGQKYRGWDFENLVVVSRPDGTVIKLGQLAKVNDHFAEQPVLMQVGSERALLLQVYKTRDKNAIVIANAVKEYLASQQSKLPTGVQLKIWTNETRYIQGRLELLIRNGWMGLVLVFFSLWFFLELRLAFWVAWGIPVSFAGALFIFDLSGQSLNSISAFGLIMALGIIVDDAIVVGENIYAHRLLGKSAFEAAIDGAAEVGVPVAASTLTTIAAFLPLFMISGVMGKFIAVLPLAMLSCLVVSLFEAMLILPVHLRHGPDATDSSDSDSSDSDSSKPNPKANPAEVVHQQSKFRRSIERGFTLFVEKFYTPVLQVCLNQRFITFCVFTAVLLISVGLLAGGFVGKRLFPDDENESYICRLRLPAGTPVTRTRQVLNHIEKQAYGLDGDFATRNGGPVVKQVLAIAGEWSGLPPEHNSHFGEIQLELTPSEERKIPSQEVINRWRERVGKIPEALSLVFTTKDLKPGGAPVEILLLGKRFETLRAAANELKYELSREVGVFDIEDDLRPGKREVRVQMTDYGRTTGLTLAHLSRDVRGAFFGSEARKIQRGRDEVKIKVRLSRSQRQSLSRLEDMRVMSQEGSEVPLTEVAEIQSTRGLSKIKRLNRSRRVSVKADVDESVNRSSEVMARIIADKLPQICAKYNVSYSLDGQARESKESIESLIPGFLLALFLIYTILAILFRSYLQPFIIMSAIPFGMVGVLWGHWIFGLDLSMLSLFGATALAGIVVNDALVLIDFINRARDEGKTAREAVELAGQGRFRAIILTSMTTIAGLFPLVLETSRQASVIIPMAVTISAGLTFATLINLILVPALYLLLVDFSDGCQWLITGEWPTEIPEKVIATAQSQH